MKILSVYRIYFLFMLSAMGGLLAPAVVAQAEDAEAPTDPATGFPRRGTVTAATLNVRARPGLFYEVIAKLEDGDKVQVLERQDDWYRIPVPKNAAAWVAARFVSENHQITGDGVRVRAGTGVAFSAYHTLDQGTSVQPTGETRDNWVRIIPPDEATAWASKQFVELVPPEIDAAVKNDTPEGQKTQTKEEPETKPTEHDAENAETTSERTGNGEPANSAIDKDEASTEQEKDADIEKKQVAEETTDSEKEGEEKNKGEESTIVDLRERVRAGRSSSESREVEMLPPIRLSETETSTEADENVRTTPRLVPEREEEKSERETDSSLIYTRTMPEEEEEEDSADIEADITADARRAEADATRHKPEQEKAPRSGKEGKTAKADKPEIPAAFRISGFVISLGDRANEAASHVVARSLSGRMAPVAYLRSHTVDLAEWEGRKLHVYGKRIPCDWSKPLIAVSGVLIAR